MDANVYTLQKLFNVHLSSCFSVSIGSLLLLSVHFSIQISLDDPVGKWMHPIEEARPSLQSVRLSQVVMRFFRDAVVPVVDDSGICVGVVHREDCFEVI